MKTEVCVSTFTEVSEIASSWRSYYAKINVYMFLGLWPSSCEFSLFVNIKYLHNIRIISSIEHFVFHSFLLYGEAYRQISMKFSSNFQPNSCNENLMDWSSVYGQTFHKLSWRSVKYFLRYLGARQPVGQPASQTNKQTNERTNKQTNKQRWKLNLLAEAMI